MTSEASQASKRATASSRSGLTLVEIAVAVGVLALLLAGLFAAMASSLKADVLTRERQAAAEAASRQLDSYLTDPALSFSADSEAYFDVPFKTGDGEVNLTPSSPLPTGWTQSRAGRVHVDVNPTDPVDGASSMGDDIVMITASVSWMGADYRAQRLDMVSMRVRQ